MELQDAKDKFIHTWGTLATQWGINRTMSQIHALLLLSPKSLNADEIMDELMISRGNVNMNLRELMSWGLIMKQLHQGERKEYFIAEKDIWKVARLIAKERRKREIEPILETMTEIKENLQPDTEDKKEVLRIIGDIYKVTDFANSSVGVLLKADESWILNNILHAFTK